MFNFTFVYYKRIIEMKNGQINDRLRTLMKKWFFFQFKIVP